METIIFSESFFKWKTIEQNTHGRFAIESVLRIFNASEQLINEYFLLSGVMASNVFHGNNLIITPTYFFQAAFSKINHKIFRTFNTHSENKDTFNNNNLIFRETNFQIIKKEAAVLNSNHDVINHTLVYHKLNGISRFKLNGNYVYEIEYPIKHINTNDSQFQVETGSLLVPGINNSENLSGMETAYLTFRDFSSGEFAINTQTMATANELVSSFSLVKKFEMNTTIVTY